MLERQVVDKDYKLHRQSGDFVNQKRKVNQPFLGDFDNPQAVLPKAVRNRLDGRAFACAHIAVEQAVVAASSLDKRDGVVDNLLALAFIAGKIVD